MTDAARAALDTVNAMIHALERRDVEAALQYLTDDVEYDNVPMGKVFGHDGVRQGLTPFLASCSEVEWVVHHEAATGDVVMNERTDRFHFPHKWAEVHVAGLFVLRDGRIALWRDYFDLAHAREQLG
jgi:limonene-1,2-epoxide hydrolase